MNNDRGKLKQGDAYRRLGLKLQSPVAIVLHRTRGSRSKELCLFRVFRKILCLYGKLLQPLSTAPTARPLKFGDKMMILGKKVN